MRESSDEKQLLVRPPGTTVISMDPSVRSVLSGGSGGLGSAASLSLSTSPVPSSPSSVCVSVWNGNDGSAAAASSQFKFQDLLQRADVEDLTTIEKTNCIYLAGRDCLGRPVIAFVGKWFPYTKVDLDKALLYLIRVIHPIVTTGDYVVIYFHTKTTNQNVPHFWWIKHVYSILPYEYKKKLKAFYVVHPTVWTRMTCWWFSTFMAPAIKSKMFNVYALQELTTQYGLTRDDSDLDLPMFIQEHDMSLHGIRYIKP